MYSAATADWATGLSLGYSYPSAVMQSAYSAAPANWANKFLFKIKFYSIYFGEFVIIHYVVWNI